MFLSTRSPSSFADLTRRYGVRLNAVCPYLLEQPSVGQLPPGVRQQSVVQLAVVSGVNASLLPHLLVQAANDRRQRWEAAGASQPPAVLPLVLVHLQQVVLLDTALGFSPQLPQSLVLHLSQRR